MSETPGPVIAGVNHIALTVTDIDASMAWYQRVFRTDQVLGKFPHLEKEETGYGLLLLEPRSGVILAFHTNTGNQKEQFDEVRTGLDHLSFSVTSQEELQAWADWLEELGIEHTGVRHVTEPFPISTVVFRDPDNIQLEVVTAG
ncbi:VOC family protein [Streptomyces sp. NPDC048430]|uniref:VOC family protein n=1 Tax=unclassified Streptomyces TaxID=2593676 RepID=UPI003446F396